MIPLLVDKSSQPSKRALIFAHGAGAGMDSVFMETVAGLIAERGVWVFRFEFPYMQQRRETGGRRPPDRQPVLLDHWRKVWEQVTRENTDIERWYIGGKSMGGRMATMLLDELEASGCVCLGYPFHPAGKPEKTRIDHLPELRGRLFIVQGTRDKLGNSQEVTDYQLPDAIRFLWLEDGDHDLKPRVRSGYSYEQHLIRLADQVVGFMQ